MLAETPHCALTKAEGELDNFIETCTSITSFFNSDFK
jgi:hypothetical protein